MRTRNGKEVFQLFQDPPLPSLQREGEDPPLPSLQREGEDPPLPSLQREGEDPPLPSLQREGEGRGKGGGRVKNEKLLEIMQRDRYLLQQRNRCIRLHWQALVGRGVPRMRAYAQTAESYYLSEKRVRDIVREGGDPPQPSLQREGEGRTHPSPPYKGRGKDDPPQPSLQREG